VMESQDTRLVSRLSRDMVFYVSVLARIPTLVCLVLALSRVSMSSGVPRISFWRDKFN